MIWTKKIRAGALQLVLFVGAIIMVLLASFLVLAYTHDFFEKKTDLAIDLIQAADQGLVDSFEKEMALGVPLDVTSQNELGITVSVTHKYWGVLPLRNAVATKGKQEFIKWALVGVSEPLKPALFLRDQQRPMVIAGQAQIVGNAFLPERGIKPGNIRGQGYNRSQLVYGQQQKSSDQLPQFTNEWNTQVQQLTGLSQEPTGETLAIEKEKVLKNSFKEPMKVFKGSTIRLEHLNLTGHIMVWATKKIIVENNCRLQDVVLIAPEIEIKKGFRGSLQALATKNINVGESCELEYPSVLLVNKNQNYIDDFKVNLSIASKTDVRGMVIFRQPTTGENSFIPDLRLAKNAQLMGELFCAGNLELRGTIYGNVTTEAFMVNENGNSYQNHLFNGKINSSLLPEAYGGLWYNNTLINQVVKWLY